ncbi:MAG: hybrid sensor histidine kinase/response regulator [Bacteroidetes bacterium]|jgi:two-component system chemotaxis sensor kinase CheA|nr:hybrid sensor histidine kinase/response regulator [Bacteroidota bacterium]
MNKKDEDFLKELLNDFKIEAAEHHQEIVSGLVKLEKENPQNPDKNLIETIFRELHSMKGAARAVNLTSIEQLCMNMEHLFHHLKDGKIDLKVIVFDDVYKAVDVLEELLQQIDQKPSPQTQKAVDQIVRKILKILNKEEDKKPALSFFDEETPKETKKTSNKVAPDEGPALGPEKNKIQKTDAAQDGNQEEAATVPTEDSLPEVEKEENPDAQTVRITLSKLISIMHQAEGLIAFKSMLDHRVEQYNQINSDFKKWRRENKEKLIKEQENSEPSTSLNDLYDFLSSHEETLFKQAFHLDHLKRMAAKSVDELLIDVRKTLMQPFTILLHIVPRLVRDLSKTQDKQIEVITAGSEIEIDRRILEELKDPLIHLIRNSIDHGIEPKEVRIKKGKPALAKLTINIAIKAGSKIELSISDDGAGIDRKKLKDSAVKKGFVTVEEAKKMSDSAAANLVFSSGISTNSFITDVSGRGLGMAIVEAKVTKLGGTIQLQSEPDKGTTFIISLPQSLSSFKGILVKASGHAFIIPTVSVLSAERIDKKTIKTIESKKTYKYLGQTIALVKLGDVLNLKKQRANAKQGEYFTALILQSSNKQMAFIVDEVLGEHEGVVKGLGAQLKHVNNIAGATILGDNTIVPVIEVSELIYSASRDTSAGLFDTDQEKTTAPEGKKRILVVEDSITVRNMLRNMVEAAGFEVKTAVNGLEGLNLAKSEEFDLVVTDIEMPRMSGFELTSKIRADNELSELPVILVTTLDSDQDKQRGMEAGANAYIVKSSFEKSNLVDTINRLI